MSNEELQHKADIFFKDAQHWQAECERANEALGELQAGFNDLFLTFEKVLREHVAISELRNVYRQEAGVPTKGEK
jgi:seryl-tRNA synthetase